MDQYQQIVQQALSEMTIAQAMIDQGNQRYYNAKRKLESLYSPASPQKGVEFTKKQLAKLTTKKPKKQLA